MVERVIVLDRDGVINADSEDYIKCLDEWIPLPGSIEAIARLSHQGYRIAVATNQAGINRGLFDLSTLNAMHERLRHLVAQLGGRIDVIAFCPHRPDEGCACRKPQPGMLLEIAQRFGVEPSQMMFVGDSRRDLEAARAAGAVPVLVLTGNGRATVQGDRELLAGVGVFADLAALADHLLGRSAPTR
jgi:D-glycero-D-manno-heptose 1,7-bisphosphate phosphatase